MILNNTIGHFGKQVLAPRFLERSKISELDDDSADDIFALSEDEALSLCSSIYEDFSPGDPIIKTLEQLRSRRSSPSFPRQGDLTTGDLMTIRNLSRSKDFDASVISLKEYIPRFQQEAIQMLPSETSHLRKLARQSYKLWESGSNYYDQSLIDLASIFIWLDEEDEALSLLRDSISGAEAMVNDPEFQSEQDREEVRELYKNIIAVLKLVPFDEMLLLNAAKSFLNFEKQVVSNGDFSNVYYAAKELALVYAREARLEGEDYASCKDSVDSALDPYVDSSSELNSLQKALRDRL